jgi:hypothetical protein
MRKSLLLVMLFFCGSVMAQKDTINFEIKKTGIFTDDYKKSDIVAVGANIKGGVTMARSYHSYFGRKHGYVFENFSDKMAKLKTYKHEMAKKEDLMGIFIDDNIINMIGFFYDKKQKAYICYAESANANDFKFARKELFRINIKRQRPPLFAAGPNLIRDYERAYITYNRDKSAFAILVDLYTGKKKKEVHNVYVFNDKLDLLVKGKLEKNFMGEWYTGKIGQYYLEDIEVAQDGTAAYILGRSRIKKKRKEKISEYKYDITRITNTDVKTKVLDSNVEFAGKMAIVEKKHELICMGFNKDVTKDKLLGINYMSFDPVTFEEQKNYQIPFPEELVNLYGKDFDKEIEIFKVKGLVIADDHVVFNAEQLHYEVTQYYDGKKFTTRTQEHYKDILSMKINNEGKVIWTKVLDKFQYTNGAARDCLSFTPMVADGGVYYFINGNLSTLENGNPYISYKGLERSDLNVMKIDADGNLKVVKLLDDSKIKVPFRIREGVGIPEIKSMFFLGREYKNKQLIRINL